MRRCKLGATKPVPVSDSPVVVLLQVLSEEHGRISHARVAPRIVRIYTLSLSLRTKLRLSWYSP